MKTAPRHRQIIAVFMLACVAVFAGRGEAYSDSSSGRTGGSMHDEVLEHRQSRDILPFADILKTTRSYLQGEIIETEFEIEDGIPIYEIKYINPLGRVLVIIVDARTGEVIERKAD